jgi:hypothetical protein
MKYEQEMALQSIVADHAGQMKIFVGLEELVVLFVPRASVLTRFVENSMRHTFQMMKIILDI